VHPRDDALSEINDAFAIAGEVNKKGTAAR